MHEKRVKRSYRLELLAAVVVYVILLFGSIRFARPMPDGVLRTVILVTPMIGFGLMIRAIVRNIARVDEYVRVRMLETIGLSAAITGALTFTYGFLETVGYPKLSMFSVWIVMGASFGAVNIVRAWRERG